VSGHCTIIPHPSSMLPHWAPCDAHVVGTHVPEPHLSGPPPPQVPASQVPHERTLPQPSGTFPHWAPKPVQVVGLHLQWWVRSHVSFGFEQMPQSTARPHPSCPIPHSQPSCGQEGTEPQASTDASLPVASPPPSGPGPSSPLTPSMAMDPSAPAPASGGDAEKD
jgi:hypothetical protein